MRLVWIRKTSKMKAMANSKLKYIIWITITGGIVFGQFSPGELSKYHAELEGTSNCVECHEVGNKEISDGCVLCHQPLKLQIDAKRGYHQDKTTGCGDCHSDHNGRAFELVYWPKNIREFDHNETGATLTGKHRDLECNQCHTQKNIVGKDIIQWAQENDTFPVLNRTFLGLSEECATCHEGIHDKEVSNTCTDCHNTTDWKKASEEFDHRQARFLLTGAHKNVACEKCHKTTPDRTPNVWKLVGMAFQNCTDCHQDHHKGSYGNTCETCHTTVDWKKDIIPFDHSKTKYPLVGKHGPIDCARCHTPNLSGTLPKYATCLECHEDEHYRQFMLRKDGGDCGACHTVQGFTPTSYTITMHQTSRFPIEGGHLAIPCISCHKPFEPVKGKPTTRFTWKQLECGNCHSDIHRNQFKEHYQNQCEQCHTVIEFSRVIFDHNATDFPLDGRHQNVSCNNCHDQIQDSEGTFIRYNPTSHQCVDCHTLTGDFR